MKKSVLRSCVSLVAVTSIAAFAAPVFAQDAAAPAAEEDATGLDEIVVTASPGNKAQIDSSVSVTNVSADLINDFKPSSEAEVFRLLPGIQVAGTSGPGGNSNIAVRGLPVATGGSPFVQIQEDGLPTVLFGDIQFGNNDYWTHFDATVANVEAVRGGSASTFASQAPGAVINYISHTGEKEGGFVELQKGINFDETRANFRYGGPITDTLRFHVGGYFKTGHGPLHADYNVSESFQVKGNVTKEFEEGTGYLQLNFKVADTQEPNYTGSPALATITGNNVSNITPFPGFDGRNQSNYSIYNRDMLILNRDRVLERVPLDGITTKAKSVGAKFHYEFSDAIKIDNNLRWTKMSGGFASPFFNVGNRLNTAVVPAGFTACTAPSTFSANGVVGSCVNGTVVASARYASGPNAGQVFTGQYVDNNVNVRTNIRDIGSFANDLALSGKFDVGFAEVTARAGYFYMNQKIAMDWHVNKSLREVNGDNPSQLDLFDVAGNRLTQAGISGYNNNWGDCCARDYDLSYTDQAPFLSLDVDADRFAVDGSIRFDRVKASGSGRAGGAEFLIDADGVPGGLQLPAITANGTVENLNYSRSYTSYSLGGLFKASDDLSIFVRASKGGRFNGDRQTFGGKISNSGSLCTSTQAAALTNGCRADGVTPSVDFVKQYELGVKNRGALLGGRYSFELTLLKGNFKQSTFELSATRCPGGAGGCVIDARFKSSGAELYATYQNSGFSLVANATYSKAKKSGVTATGTPTPFARSPNLPDLSYTISANYDADIFSAGIATTGQTSATDDAGRVYPGKAIFNGNLRVRPIENLELGIQAYNLFNTFDLRGNGGVADGSVTPTVISGAPALGRTFTASARFSF
jgi:outer membrane receptor protein involved in Fe transport